MATECSSEQAQTPLRNWWGTEAAKSQAISYWFPNVTGYKLLNLSVFTSGKEKLTALKWKKKKKINHHKCWKRPRVFLKRLPENVIITKIYTKRAHGRQETFMICSFASFYCMTHLTQVARYRKKVKLVISEVMIQFSHSFIYFEVGHRQIFPGLESSSFPKARKS